MLKIIPNSYSEICFYLKIQLFFSVTVMWIEMVIDELAQIGAKTILNMIKRCFSYTSIYSESVAVLMILMMNFKITLSVNVNTLWSRSNHKVKRRHTRSTSRSTLQSITHSKTDAKATINYEIIKIIYKLKEEEKN